MKYLQMRLGKYVTVAAFVLCCGLSAGAQTNAYLAKADTLFRKKQFTQSLELYEQLFKQGKYSPAMLLRMAYIEEGLGRVPETLFYLSRYYRAAGDNGVLYKISELAEANKLTGYGITPQMKIRNLLEDNFMLIAAFLAAPVLLMMAVALARKRKGASPRSFIAVSMALCILLAAHVTFSIGAHRGITAQPDTYLMTGPSAAAPVAAIIPAGNNLRITGTNDVWLKTEWEDQTVYVKKFALWPL